MSKFYLYSFKISVLLILHLFPFIGQKAVLDIDIQDSLNNTPDKTIDK